MFGSAGRRTDFGDFSVYKVTSPAPAKLQGWYWELKATYESGGPESYEDAVEIGRKKAGR